MLSWAIIQVMLSSWIQGRKEWDSIFIHDLLPSDVAARICNTPLVESVRDDVLIWNLIKHGGYSIK